MNGIVAGATNHQGLASSGCHDLGPQGLAIPSSLLEISQFADVMHFNVLSGLAEFTGVCQEPFEQFVPLWSSRGGGGAIGEHCLGLATKRNASKACNQWWFFFALHLDLQADIGARRQG